MDQIRWINHAGFELQTEGIKIVCDPWLSGFAFNQSWALISETRFKPSDFEGVDYLWFSHEHPDHFSPSNIRSIPEDIRSGITVLFQKTKDRRVAKFCEGLGFKAVRELSDWERIELGRGVFFSLTTVDEDSLCLIETPQFRYLNINDCVGPDAEKFHAQIKQKIQTSPDVLLTQFSFANWAGNPGDFSAMKSAADQKIDQIQIQLEIYKPKILIPFASYVWFCRPDNFHLNAGANKISDIHDRFSKEVECVVLYPGDVYITGQQSNSLEAVTKYKVDQDRHHAPLDIDEKSSSASELEKMSFDHQMKLRQKNKMWSLAPLRVFGFIKPITIFLTDLDLTMNYSMFHGIKWVDKERHETDIEFTSGAMAQMLRYGTGYDTLYISGRFVEHTHGARFALSRHFAVARRNEHGQFFPATFFDLQKIQSRLKTLPTRVPQF